MKKLFYFLSAALMMLAAVSCGKFDDDTPAPYYKLATSFSISSGTSSGKTDDFSEISSVVSLYNYITYRSEKEALSAYNEVLAKTKDASYSAAGDSYYKLYVARLVGKRESEYVIDYNYDESYKSPAGHIWDAKGSRDL